MNADASPPVGSVIGEHYRVLDVLGSGGMGIVLRALDEHLDREVALKLIHREQLEHADMRGRFRAEARAMARVHHVNVVEIHAYGEHERRPYFVMEYVPGMDLASWRRRRHPLPLADAMVVLDQVCHGVSAIHRAGALHRDIKPNNVLIGPGRRVAVADLGLAQLIGRSEDASSARIIGTPAYIAPELARGEKVLERLAQRIDVYGLGVMAFELLTGRLPFRAKGVPGMLAEHGHSPPPKPSSASSELGMTFDQPILEALAKDPADRTPDVESFRRGLQAAFERSCRPLADLDLLLADDELSNLQAMAGLLEDVFPGARIRCVTDGRAAARAAAEQRPSVVITDLDMPHRGGIELTAALRSSPETADVPIIVVTGQGGAKDWKVLRALGADRFLVKPVDPDSLVNEIRALLGRDPGGSLA